MGRLLCRFGIHDWQRLYSIPLTYTWRHCRRCGRDADLREALEPGGEGDWPVFIETRDGELQPVKRVEARGETVVITARDSND